MRWLNRAQSTEQVGAGPRGSERPMASGTADVEAPGADGVGGAGARGGGSGHPEAPRPTPGRWGAQAARLGGWHRAGQEPRGAAWSRGAEWAQSPGAAPELGPAGSGGDAGGCKRRWSGRQALSQSLFAGSASCGGRGERPVHTLRFSVPPQREKFRFGALRTLKIVETSPTHQTMARFLCSQVMARPIRPEGRGAPPC